MTNIQIKSKQVISDLIYLTVSEPCQYDVHKQQTLYSFCEIEDALETKLYLHENRYVNTLYSRYGQCCNHKLSLFLDNIQIPNLLLNYGHFVDGTHFLIRKIKVFGPKEYEKFGLYQRRNIDYFRPNPVFCPIFY